MRTGNREKNSDSSNDVTAVINRTCKSREMTCPALPKPENIAKAANRLFQRLRPENPRNSNFSVEEDAFPVGFYKGEVRVKEQHHLIFATGQQLTQLAVSKSLYVDGTFKLVLREIINLLPGETTAVQQVTVDFKKGLWSALRTVLTDVQIRGCVFHWTQAIRRKGSLLGPRLYGVHANDLPDSSVYASIEMFADDSTAYCAGNSVDEVTLVLQEIINDMNTWSKSNSLTIHQGKTEPMVITRSGFIRPFPNVTMDVQAIYFVPKSTCLGIEVDNLLKWSAPKVETT
ncbi:hypothetical protein AWC38_SpisGene22963 [Stylophora pistillata]|uniref:Reverse transcriptase domain-containing protein n=1 Tax=Stylophora pistillata TaxID=50429 RepID=A0A2B4R9D0_STYPI|nr:hypothetical protein AWC38_SpisGene22963 [Stylophora pistillata]